MAQTIKTEVQNQHIQDLLLTSYISGSSAPYTTLVNVASPSNVNLASMTKSFNYAYRMTCVLVTCDTHDLEVRLQTGFNPNLSAPYSEARARVVKGQTTIIPFNGGIIRNSGDARVNVTKVFVAGTDTPINTLTTPTTISGSVSFIGNIETSDIDLTSDMNFVAIGDSITVSETGLTSTQGKSESMMWQIRYQLRKLGYRIKYILKGISGTNTAQHLTKTKEGEYDIPNVGLFNILLGTNDAAQAVTSSTYIANITEIVSYLRNINPKATIVICGPTPTDNNTWHTLLEQYRTDLQSYVTGLADPYIKFINLGTAFTRTDLANYASSDSVGSKIHLSAQGQLAVSTLYMAQWASQGITIQPQ